MKSENSSNSKSLLKGYLPYFFIRLLIAGIIFSIPLLPGILISIEQDHYIKEYNKDLEQPNDYAEQVKKDTSLYLKQMMSSVDTYMDKVAIRTEVDNVYEDMTVQEEVILKSIYVYPEEQISNWDTLEEKKLQILGFYNRLTKTENGTEYYRQELNVAYRRDNKIVMGIVDLSSIKRLIASNQLNQSVVMAKDSKENMIFGRFISVSIKDISVSIKDMKGLLSDKVIDSTNYYMEFKYKEPYSDNEIEIARDKDLKCVITNSNKLHDYALLELKNILGK